MKEKSAAVVEETRDSWSVISTDVIPIYRWNGEYFGYIFRKYLFDAESNYVGWVEQDGCVWRANGAFLGEIVDRNYILKRIDMVEPPRRVCPIAPVRPVPPIAEMNRPEREPRFGWADALE
jgi:hypothetical protein